MKITNIGVKVHFWHDFKKVKKWILLDIFSRKGPMTLKMCGKKTYDPSGFSPEIFFYLKKNWQKYWQLESCHFFFDHTVANKKGTSFLRQLNEAIRKGPNQNQYALYFLMIFAFRPPNRKLPNENLFRIIDLSGVSLVRMRFWAT